MEVIVPHNLPPDEVKSRVQKAIAEIKRNFSHEISDETEEWNGHNCSYSFKARGYKLSGAAQIRHAEVWLKLKLPLIAYPFKGKIRSIIQQQLGNLLS